MSQRQEDKQKIADALTQLKDLEQYFDERIVDLHQVKGGTQARHAYVLYRKFVLEIQETLEGK